MPRIKRPLDREAGVLRDANLLIIASEDKYAAKQYFAHFRTKRVQVVVLETIDDRSAPQHVLQRLNNFKKALDTQPGDTFWLCIDRDRWQLPTLVSVLKTCIRKKYGIALSVPCFELWLLLHYEELQNSHPHTTQGVQDRLKQILNGYTKNCCSTLKLTKEMVELAMTRGRDMDVSGHLVPQTATTQVYKILEEMLAHDLLDYL